MTMDEYQTRAKSTAIYINPHDQLVCTALGLNGEAGEVAEKLKKIIRDKAWVIDDADKKEILKELGDVLWYLSVFADSVGWSLEEVAAANLEKLSSRKQRGVISGSGDNR